MLPMNTNKTATMFFIGSLKESAGAAHDNINIRIEKIIVSNKGGIFNSTIYSSNPIQIYVLVGT